MILLRTLAAVLKVKLGAYCHAYRQETNKQFGNSDCVLSCAVRSPSHTLFRQYRGYRRGAHIQTTWHKYAVYTAVLKQINFHQTSIHLARHIIQKLF